MLNHRKRCIYFNLNVINFKTAGYFFGNLPQVKHNFSLVILGIIAISMLPIVWEAVKGWRAGKSVGGE